MSRNYRFSTDRLLIDDWHSFNTQEWPAQDLTQVVQSIMTEPVTKTLPPPWQGHYSADRAGEWIAERDREGVTLLAIDKADKQTVALTVLFDSDDSGHIRLGYMLAEAAWGKGLGTELIKGLVAWCRQNQIKSVVGGVEKNNIASARVLEKCGFTAELDTGQADQLMYKITFD